MLIGASALTGGYVTKARGGLDALSELLAHESPDVGSAAAAFLLRYKTEEALAVLREVAQRPGLIGFEASEAIKRWEEGEWHLDE